MGTLLYCWEIYFNERSNNVLLWRVEGIKLLSWILILSTSLRNVILLNKCNGSHVVVILWYNHKHLTSLRVFISSYFNSFKLSYFETILYVRVLQTLNSIGTIIIKTWRINGTKSLKYYTKEFRSFFLVFISKTCLCDYSILRNL